MEKDINVENYTPNPENILEVKDLKMYFDVTTGFLKTKKLKAVDGVSFSIKKGETLGLVGESGCGKTTLGRTLMFLYKPTGGQVYFKGQEIGSKESLKTFRKKAQMVFQDPYSSLNPRLTVADIVAEPIDVHGLCKTKKERDERIAELLNTVGINTEQATRYPHEFSGGQRQRIGIARALASNPEFIVCDEPVSALDVSIQAQVINMLEDLQKKMGLTYLFIAHDISVVKHISDRIAVMYLGRMVELGNSIDIHRKPLHPYTISLLSAVPIADPKTARASKRIPLQGDIPSPLNAPSGCAFRTRCPFATQKCSHETPQFKEVEKGHFVACHNVK